MLNPPHSVDKMVTFVMIHHTGNGGLVSMQPSEGNFLIVFFLLFFFQIIEKKATVIILKI